jgi:multiple sugar transport system substrate-binding protein
MATMKDVAKLAKVSQGTVSNVLNNRGNVSAEKIKLVKNAAKKLDYSLNAQAQQLRHSSNLTNTVAFILPNIIEDKYAAFFTSAQKRFQDLNYNAMLFVTDDSPYLEECAINTVVSMRACAVISVSCLDAGSKLYQALIQIGTSLIFAERKPPASYNYIGFDYLAAGRDIGEALSRKGYESIGIFMGNSRFSNEADFEKGIRGAFAGKGRGSANIHTRNSSYATSIISAFSLLSTESAIEAVVCSNRNICNSVFQACSINSARNDPAIYSLVHRRENIPNERVVQYCLDYSLLGYEASQQIIGWLGNSSNDNAAVSPSNEALCRILPANGFGISRSVSFSTAKLTLNVLMAISNSTDALRYITPKFEKETGIRINFVTLPLADLTETLAQMPYSEGFDVIRTNVTSTPYFPLDALIPIETSRFMKMTATMMLRPVRLFSYIAQTPYAIPFDIGFNFQIYRKDLFEDSICQRLFFETFGTRLELPKNDKEYNTICRFFSRAHNPESPVEYGTTGIVNENTTIVYAFYNRYQLLGAKFFDGSGNLCFDKRIATQAIALYCDMLSFSLRASDASRKEIPVLNFLEGKTAIEYITAAYASFLADLKKNQIRGRIGFTRSPNLSTFGGGALAVPRKSKHPDEAMQFIEWACGEDQAYLFTLLGGISPHRHVYQDHEILQLYPWFTLIAEEADKEYITSDLDLLNRYRFESLIGKILRNAFNGIITPENAAELIGQNIVSCQL